MRTMITRNKTKQNKTQLCGHHTVLVASCIQSNAENMIDFTNKSSCIPAILSTIIAILSPALYLLYQLNHPTVLKFPWPSYSAESSNKHNHKKDKQTKVVFAGSFNPPHNGHLVMAKYLASRYKEVIVVIGVNPNKTYSVTPEQRAEILSKMIESLNLGDDCNIRVEGKFLMN